MEDHSHFLTDEQAVLAVVVQGDAVDDDGAAVDLLQTVEAPEKGGLSRTRRADNDDHLSPPDREGKAIQSDDPAGEGFRELRRLDDPLIRRHARPPILRRGAPLILRSIARTASERPKVRTR